MCLQHDIQAKQHNYRSFGYNCYKQTMSWFDEIKKIYTKYLPMIMKVCDFLFKKVIMETGKF